MTDTPAENNSAARLSGHPAWRQWWSVWTFLTRLPGPAFRPVPLGQAAWAFPIAGFAVGCLGALAMTVAAGLGLGPLAAAAVGTGLTVWLTGALHEDGLADCADAFGLPRSAERIHAILKDPRMGTFGVIALCLSLLLRVVLAAEAGPLALIAAETISRAVMALAMAAATPAGSGQALAAGRAPAAGPVIGGLLALGVGIGLAGPGLLAGAFAAALAAGWLLLAARRRLGGYTGDVLGATQQLALLGLLAGAAIGP